MVANGLFFNGVQGGEKKISAAAKEAQARAGAAKKVRGWYWSEQ